jgi:hypothetical protein
MEIVIRVTVSQESKTYINKANIIHNGLIGGQQSVIGGHIQSSHLELDSFSRKVMPRNGLFCFDATNGKNNISP